MMGKYGIFCDEDDDGFQECISRADFSSRSKMAIFSLSFSSQEL